MASEITLSIIGGAQGGKTLFCTSVESGRKAAWSLLKSKANPARRVVVEVDGRTVFAKTRLNSQEAFAKYAWGDGDEATDLAKPVVPAKILEAMEGVGPGASWRLVGALVALCLRPAFRARGISTTPVLVNGGWGHNPFRLERSEGSGEIPDFNLFVDDQMVVKAAKLAAKRLPVWDRMAERLAQQEAAEAQERFAQGGCSVCGGYGDMYPCPACGS